PISSALNAVALGALSQTFQHQRPTDHARRFVQWHNIWPPHRLLRYSSGARKIRSFLIAINTICSSAYRTLIFTATTLQDIYWRKIAISSSQSSDGLNSSSMHSPELPPIQTLQKVRTPLGNTLRCGAFSISGATRRRKR